MKLETKLWLPATLGGMTSEREQSSTDGHFITWESNFPALCKKVRQISCSPRISHELFSKHSNTPQPTSPAFTRQCWISAETAERERMWFLTLVKGRHLILILRFLWAYTRMHIQTNLFFLFIQDCYLLKGLLSLERNKAKWHMGMHKDITFHLICLEEDRLVPILGFVSQLKTQELYLEDLFSTESERAAEVIKVCY